MEFKPSFINVTYHRAEQIFKKAYRRQFRPCGDTQAPGHSGYLRRIDESLSCRRRTSPDLRWFCQRRNRKCPDRSFTTWVSTMCWRSGATSPGNKKFFTPHPQGHRYAVELVEQVMSLNKGRYLEEDIVDAGKNRFLY